MPAAAEGVSRSRALVLDFDGVVSDSAPEAFVVAVGCRAETDPDGPASRLWADLAGSGLPDRSRVEAHPLYPAFVEQMPLGARAEDYAVSLTLLEQRRPASDQSSFDAARAELSHDHLNAFHRRFYAVRHDLARRSPEAWLALMGPYPELLALLRRRAGQVHYAIATAKDRPSVIALLDRYGIAELIPPEHLLDKDVGASKRLHLERLGELLELRFEEMTFVDDKVPNLDAVAPLGVRCVLAAWGYNAEREREQARLHGHLVCSIPELERQLFGPS